VSNLLDKSEHMVVNELDNPVWYALIGPHALFATGVGQARHYPRDAAPFSAIAEPSPAAYADLATDLLAGVEARLFRPGEEPTPDGWETISARPIIQMVFDRSTAPLVDRGATEVYGLAASDVPQMLALADMAKPGPFGARTITLGNYVGVVDQETGRLVAMGGERFRLPSCVELSGIAVQPDSRGRGLGRAVTAYLVKTALRRQLVPFLHVFPENPATALYAKLGFRERTRLWVLWRRPLATP
jgi:GNAT superfamily N-acetyltransferase